MISDSDSNNRKDIILGSNNTIGFGSHMLDNNNTFACFGLRGMTNKITEKY